MNIFVDINKVRNVLYILYLCSKFCLHKYYAPMTWNYLFLHVWNVFCQNLVMFLSLVVAWVIPDVPKTIVEQLKREKKLLVDVFLQEEKEKFQLIRNLFSKDAILHPGGPMQNPGQGPLIPGRYSTLPPGPTQGLAGDRGGGGGEGPRARCRAASFSQFTRNNPPSPRNENENSRHTAVWHTSVLQWSLRAGEHVAQKIQSLIVSACVLCVLVYVMQ